jgi:hypothetical protein
MLLEKMDWLRNNHPAFWQWVERNEIDWGGLVEVVYSDAQSNWEYAPTLFALRRLVEALETQDWHKAEYYASSVKFTLEEK